MCIGVITIRVHCRMDSMQTCSLEEAGLLLAGSVYEQDSEVKHFSNRKQHRKKNAEGRRPTYILKAKESADFVFQSA